MSDILKNRFAILGVILVLIGVAFVISGLVARGKISDGYDSLKALSAAQNVQLSYNEDGDLVDRGTVEGAQGIMDQLTKEWKFVVDKGDFDPNDPVVNTASEFMFQLSTIIYHIRHGTQTITLDKDVEYKGETFKAGTYEFEVDGRYYADFDRQHPLEGPARGLAWSATAHGLIGQLGVGAITSSTLQLGSAIAWSLFAIGLVLIFTGGGVVWASGSLPRGGAVN